MSDGSGILTPDDIDGFRRQAEMGGTYDEFLEFVGRFIATGVAEGRFTEKQAQHDMGIALWVAYACNGADDYEHYCTTIEWLSRVEDQASGWGPWFDGYATALMYTGKPRLAMEYASRGVEEDPDYPDNWLILGRLRSHFGDPEGAAAAASRGLRLSPEDPRFERLAADIAAGRSLEEMEFASEEFDDCEGIDIHDAFWYEHGPVSDRAESVMGISVDPGNLAEIKAALSPTGWIADHPYCTYMADTASGQVLVTFAMDEAFLSKMPSRSIARIIDAIPDLRAAAAAHLESRGESRPLYGVTVDRRLRPMLSFGGFEDEGPSVVCFDQDLNLIPPEAQGGPFVAFALLSDDSFDTDALRSALARDWGIRCSEDADSGNLVFEIDGHLAAFSLVGHPVPDGEAEDNAVNNYLWPEAVETVSRHRAHALVVLVNHGGTPVDAALTHTKLVASACRLPNVLGIYFQGTVVRPEEYLRVADGIRAGELPVLDWIWFGMYRGEDGGINAYTRGMTTFGREEIEIVGARDAPELIREFLYNVAYNILESDIRLEDGDHVGYSDGISLAVSLSQGVSVEGLSLKIEYPSRRRFPALT